MTQNPSISPPPSFRPTRYQRRHIVLVGMMGVGKSAVGKIMSRRVGCKFVDLDQEIERALKISVEKIFAQCGEAGFRSIETHALRYLINTNDFTIFSLGGGTYISEINQEIIKQKNALVIWLDGSVDTLYERLLRGLNKRPLIKGLSPVDLRQKIVDLRNTRTPWYQKADIKISINGDSPKTTAHKLMATLSDQGYITPIDDDNT